jgi:hypothetical protein
MVGSDASGSFQLLEMPKVVMGTVARNISAGGEFEFDSADWQPILSHPRLAVEIVIFRR